jgi:beta-lactamase superfamily II metal-dependent hydrolase
VAIKFQFLEACNGDSIFISTEQTNVLIDGGESGTFEFDFLDEVEIIDIMILTHYDSDHIGGLIDLLEEEEGEILRNPNYISKIKEVWANSYDETLKPEIQSNETSIKQQNQLLQLMANLKHKVNFKNNFSVDNQRHFKHQDLEFILLSPNNKKLASAKSEIEKYKKDNLTANIIQTYSKDCMKNIHELKDIQFVKDTRIANGASIAFILVYKEKNYLFLSDAHISLIVDELKKLTKKFHNFEFIKLSHHGSKHNITKEFIQLTTTKNYVILTNGKRHGHPDKETLSKILVYRNNKNDKTDIPHLILSKNNIFKIP